MIWPLAVSSCSATLTLTRGFVSNGTCAAYRTERQSEGSPHHACHAVGLCPLPTNNVSSVAVRICRRTVSPWTRGGGGDDAKPGPPVNGQTCLGAIARVNLKFKPRANSVSLATLQREARKHAQGLAMEGSELLSAPSDIGSGSGHADGLEDPARARHRTRSSRQYSIRPSCCALWPVYRGDRMALMSAGRESCPSRGKTWSVTWRFPLSKLGGVLQLGSDALNMSLVSFELLGILCFSRNDI